MGIGACLLKVGDLRSAQAAFERTLTLDPDNADAHLGLAIIKLNNSDVQQVRAGDAAFPFMRTRAFHLSQPFELLKHPPPYHPTLVQGLADGLKLLTRAFDLDPGHVGVISLLAHFHLLKGENDKVCCAELVQPTFMLLHATPTIPLNISHNNRCCNLTSSLLEMTIAPPPPFLHRLCSWARRLSRPATLPPAQNPSEPSATALSGGPSMRWGPRGRPLPVTRW